MSMGFEFRRAFQLETKRLIWLIGLVFGTIILCYRVEIPTGDALWSRLTWGTNNLSREAPGRMYPSENHTLTSNLSSIETRNNDLVLPSLQSTNFSFTLDEPYVEPPTALWSMLPRGINNISREDPGFFHSSKNHTSESNLSSIEIRNNELTLPPLQSANFSLTIAAPPVTLYHSEVTLDKKGSILSENNSLPYSPSIPEPAGKTTSQLQRKAVLTLSDMNELLVQSHLTPNSMIPKWSTKADGELVAAKSLIEAASPLSNGLYAPLYHNASKFQRSYELMEQTLKVYIYQEGDRPIFHTPSLEGIYASEGWFMKLLETNRHFVTNRPDEAHLFYLPFSSQKLRETLYIPDSHSQKSLVQHLKNYLDMISAKYPFWNRTDGADHFLVACHDWAPSETKRYMSNCIRALCHASVRKGFNFGKDVSFPTTQVRNAEKPLGDVGGKAPSKRKILAFYAGNMHGYVRPILLQHWANNTDMKIFGRLPSSTGNRNYIDYMKSSKYCICPRGYEVNSPRVVEAIFYECVPVIISDNYVPPLFETLNWESFAVFVAQKDIPNLKNILLSIPEKTYFRMHMRVRKVQQHFLWHPKPVKYDLFHMTLHSIWYNRVFRFRPR